ncbi:MAG: sulfatase [Phycisphaerales bacterium]|nr:sulfatase [Phycisphaerales bacterium]
MTINIRFSVTAFFVTLGTLCHIGRAASEPNFILILADDQGWGTTSVMMDPLVPDSKSDFFKTPNIERLAAAGLRFSEAYAAHPNCSPSRASIQTGRSPAALHLTDIIERNAGPNYVGNKLIPPRHVSALPRSEQTIAELLKAHDPAYHTAHFGKWHLAAGGPANFGYDESDGPTGNGEGGRKTNLPDDPKQIFSLTRKAIAFINEQSTAKHPFYLQISHYATHEPTQNLPATLKEFENAAKGARHVNAPYGAMLHDMDTGIGQVLDAVTAAGIADNTYIIYTSDNGSVPTDDPGNINGPVKGWKASVWEGGIRVPFMVVGPGIKGGAVSRTPVVGYDLLPTICDLAGINQWPKAVEGGSFKSLLLGKVSDAVKRPEDFLVFHWPHYQLQKQSTPDTTIISDGWKLHYWWETKKVQLFHLDKDLAESNDMAAREPQRAAAMKATLEGYLAHIDAQLPTTNPTYNAATDPGLNRRNRRGGGDD